MNRIRRKSAWLPLVAGTVTMAAAALAQDSNRHTGEYLHDVRTEVETPHTKWLKPSAMGKPNVLFLARRPGNLGRRVVEVWQRMDLDYAAYLYAPDASERDYWESNIAGSRTPEKIAEAEQKLSRIYDAIVLLSFDTDWLPTQAKYWLLRQVKGGCGLIAVDSRLPFKLLPESGFVEAICTGIPFSALPGYSSAENLKRYQAKSWQDLPPRVVQAGTFGRGRAVSLSFSTFGIDPEDEIYSDYHYALVVKALQWAIPKVNPAVRFLSLPEGTAVDRSAAPKPELPITLSLTAEKDTTFTMETAVRHPILGALARQETEVVLKPGQNSVSVPIPPIPAGQHLCDVRIRSGAAVVNFASFGLRVDSSLRIGEFVLDPPFVDRSAPQVSYRVALSEPLQEKAELRLSVTDTYGRAIADSTTPLEAGRRDVEGKIPMELNVAIAQWVRAELRRDGQTLDTQQKLLIVRRPGPPEYPGLLWGGCEAGLDGLRQLRRQRELGFNICLTGVSPDGASARFTALADMQLCINATHVSGVSDGKQGKVTNPTAMKDATEKVAQHCKASAPYGVYIYSLGDECYSGGPRQPFAPSDIAAYREFLKGRYESLDDLNRLWGTAWKSFDEIEPADWEKSASDPKSYPQLHERASFVESLYARTMHEHDQTLTAMDPSAWVGAEGSEPGDLELTLQGLEMWGPYRDRRIDVLLHSLAPRDLVRGMWWGGYHSGFFDRSTVVRHLWWQVLEGVSNTNFYFDGHVGHHESNCASDLSWAEYFRKLIPELRIIHETAGPLMSATRPIESGVAFLWSQASEHATLFYAPFGNAQVECTTQFSPFDQSGVSYRFITTRAVEKSGIDPQDTRLLILPLSTAISRREAEAMQAYVTKGGLLLANGSVGRMDGHCALVETGQLDALLGIQHTGRCRVEPRDIARPIPMVRAPPDSPGLALPVDVTLKAAGARVDIAAGDVPLLTVNSVGKGKAVFFNGSFTTLDSRGELGTALKHAVFADLMKQAGIGPLFQVEPRGAARGYSFAIGQTTVISFLRGEESPATAGLKLTRKAHVYNCLQGKYLGETDEIRRTEADGLFGLYGLVPAQAAPPKIEVAGEARPGSLLKIRISMENRADTLLRVDPYRPDGSWVRPLRRLVRLEGGKPAEVDVPFAFNDPKGDWTFKVTDLPTGLQASVKVALK